MDFFAHTAAWLKGEQFEMAMSALAGGMVLVFAFVFCQFGTTSAARAMVLPLVILGAVLLSPGAFGLWSEPGKIDTMRLAYESDGLAFVQAEQERIEGFESIYAATAYSALALFIAAFALFWFTLNPHARAFAIALSFLGCACFMFDFFSKERADRYHREILSELAEIS